MVSAVQMPVLTLNHRGQQDRQPNDRDAVGFMVEYAPSPGPYGSASTGRVNPSTTLINTK